MNVNELKIGDKVLRRMGRDDEEHIDMLMEITAIDDKIITCAAIVAEGARIDENWTFDKQTGYEIDHDLQWGPEYGVSGSRLIGAVLTQ